MTASQNAVLGRDNESLVGRALGRNQIPPLRPLSGYRVIYSERMLEARQLDGRQRGEFHE
jgi:hypothetical protein